ncbi:response regulator transcription factor [Erysipelotrichaceae bacterium 51-3]|uniref:response regulator transcription factor n=1 Tax=Allobaculum sp. JKK-2023 TaxID=3108943 RepID=UPI002B0539B3|nr:response regulator transcription factor [Allobaculum sp. JKK-2023]
MYKIMIVEDDPSVSGALASVLESWGFDARRAETFDDILEQFESVKPDLVLMDLNLPERNGFFWTGEIRKFSSVPIIFISSADENMNVITALNQGADDYITKPFDISVLVSKIRALLRRTFDYTSRTDFLEHKGVRLDTGSNEVSYNGKTIDLSKNEAKILKILMENKDRIVRREQLMDALWKTDCYIDENTLSVNVNRLRRKLEGIDLFDYVITRKGIGYMV